MDGQAPLKRRPGEEKLNRGAADDEADHHSTPTATLELRAIVKGVGSARDHDVAAHGIGARAGEGREEAKQFHQKGREGWEPVLRGAPAENRGAGGHDRQRCA